MRSLFLTAITLVFVISSCNSSSFSSSARKGTRILPPNSTNANPTGADPASAGTNGNTGNPASSGNTNNDGNISDDGSTLTQCPPDSQKILIIDMKSGWWAGDGGNFYQTITKEISMPCNGTISVDYHHVIKNLAYVLGGAGYSFIDDDWSQYTQIWLLSGALNDGLDFLPTEDIFVKIRTKIASSQASIFIGAGFGSIMHANPAAEALGLGTPFATSNTQGPLLAPQSGLTVVNRMTKAAGQLVEHPLFSRGITSIADQINMLIDANGIDGVATGPGIVKGDYLTTNANIEVVGRDTEGRDAIGVSKTGRRIVLDAGLQRFYSFWSGAASDPETLTYIQNILVYLSL